MHPKRFVRGSARRRNFQIKNDVRNSFSCAHRHFITSFCYYNLLILPNCVLYDSNDTCFVSSNSSISSVTFPKRAFIVCVMT